MAALRGSAAPDTELLRAELKIDSLPEEHPARRLWQSETDSSRFAIHHLADDIRVVRNVPGAPGLIRLLKSDPTNYQDFRYELRIAALLARSADQEVLCLAGAKKGPDIEARAKSGHRIGIACYRASSSTPAVNAAREFCRELAGVVAAQPTALVTDQRLVFSLRMFPVKPEESQLAKELAKAICSRTDLGSIVDGGVTVSRLKPPDEWRQPGDIVRIGVEAQFPIPEWERERMHRSLTVKLEKERASWAGGFADVPTFAIEGSDFATDVRSNMPTFVTPDWPFRCGFLTHISTPPGTDGVEHGLERLTPYFSDGPLPDGSRMHIGFETFGDNYDSWKDGKATIELAPGAASEEWEIWRTRTGAFQRCVQKLCAPARMARLPYPDDRWPDTTDPSLIPTLAKVLGRLRDERPVRRRPRPR